MISEEIKKLIYDKDVDKDVRASVLPLLIEEAKSSRQSSLGSFLTSAPFAALLSAVLVAGITEIIRQQTRGDELDHERSLERQKFQYEVISTSLSELKTPRERAETLRFLHDIKILDGLDEDKLNEWASEDAAPPAFATANTTTETSGLFVEPDRRTVNEYKEMLGDDIYGRDTSDLIPVPQNFLELLGEPGTRVESCLKQMALPYQMVLDWNKRQTVSSISVHQATLPYFERAFQNIVEAGIQDHARLFGGTYNMRKARGGSNWSLHAWGVSIDIDATFNSLRAGPDVMTMHPQVVSAFKDAGFAWGGDRGFDGMSFTISTETLEEIKSTGVNYLNGCDS